jgi:hypothetical protein
VRVISRFADTALDESAPDPRVKLFKELARLRASEPKHQRREASEEEIQLREPRSVSKE